MMGEGELLRGTQEPGARMGSMMSPLIAFRDDVPVLVAGAAGGSRIRSSLLQVLVNVVHRRMSAASAIAAPRLNPVPGKVHVEPGMSSAVLSAIAEHDEVVIWPGLDSYFGGVAGIDEHGPGADPRRGGDTRLV
jgi:gamma-glutamyltranspeptidase/glutathione hydrolase